MHQINIYIYIYIEVFVFCFYLNIYFIDGHLIDLISFLFLLLF